MTDTNYVGKRLPRYDGMQHATGKTRYVGDVKLPNMLYVKAWRSPVASALIKSIDISRAKKLLNWMPSIGLEEGIRKTIPYFKHRLGLG